MIERYYEGGVSMEDSRILELYRQRDEQAIRETKNAYGGYCFSVANAVLENAWDAEEVVAETWVRAWNSIPPNRPAHLKQYLAKIARNLALNTYLARNAQKRKGDQVAIALEELGECIPSHETAEGHLEAEELKYTISRFLRTQSLREQGIFLRRYFYLEPVERIARYYGLKEANVFQILSRTRRKLKAYLQKEGYAL